MRVCVSVAYASFTVYIYVVHTCVVNYSMYVLNNIYVCIYILPVEGAIVDY